MDEAIRRALDELVAAQFALPVDVIGPDTGPDQVPTWDSLAQIQLVVRVERRFSVRLSVDDVMAIETVADLRRALARALGASAPPTPRADPSPRTTVPLHGPSEVYWGSTGLARWVPAGTSRIALVHGPTTTRLPDGAFAGVDAEVRSFTRDRGEPTAAGIERLAAELAAFEPGLVVAIGGGSTIDTAKLARARAEVAHFALDGRALGDTPTWRSRLWAIPTVFGSGAEVSGAAVYARASEASARVVVFSRSLMPDVAFLDPALAREAPARACWAAALDAVAHAVEAATSTLDHPLATGFAHLALRDGERLLARAGTPFGDRERDVAARVGYYAGVAQQHRSVGACHALAHQLGAHGLAHGQAVGLLLGSVIAFNDRHAPGVYDALLASTGIGDLDLLATTIDRAVEATGLVPAPDVLARIEAERVAIARGALADRAAATNPVPLDVAALAAILDAALGRWA